MSEALKKLFRNSVKNIKFIGITGTNGKSSVAFMLYDFLTKYDKDCLLIGTHIIKSKNFQYASNNTTLSLSEIYYYLKQAKFKKGFLVMEVSSQGIANNRVKGLEFDYLIYTSITSDHLDYHLNIENYVNTKLSLLKQLKYDGILILNRECKYYKKILEVNNKTDRVLTYGFDGCNNTLDDYKINIVDENKFRITALGKDEILIFNTLGINNLRNLSILYIFSLLNRIDENFVCDYIHNFSNVEGRFEKIVVRDKIIIIDYAHTSSAVIDIIKEVKRIYKKQICVIVGCGGDRDKSKRPIIGNSLKKLADKRIITTDNNRNEAFCDIAKDIIGQNKEDFIVIENRLEAIFYALNNYDNNEIILILGKGTEKNNVECFYMTDKEIVLKWEEVHASFDNHFN